MAQGNIIKHTPSPWKLEQVGGGHNYNIKETDTDIHLGSIGDAEESSKIGYLSGNEILANAHLVIAAPDLLEAMTNNEEDSSFYPINSVLTLLLHCSTPDVYEAIMQSSKIDIDTLITLFRQCHLFLSNSHKAINKALNR